MKTQTFTLILSGVAEITPELADALYAATHGDIELNQRDGVVFLEVERKAATLREAITAAIREVETADVGARVVRVESEAANVIAKINADLLGAITTG
jgi:regulator of protease activity HflC (stomatin/prohibitin superfamily)